MGDLFLRRLNHTDTIWTALDENCKPSSCMTTVYRSLSSFLTLFFSVRISTDTFSARTLREARLASPKRRSGGGGCQNPSRIMPENVGWSTAHCRGRQTDLHARMISHSAGRVRSLLYRASVLIRADGRTRAFFGRTVFTRRRCI